MLPWSSTADDNGRSALIPPQQLAAAESPGRKTADLLGNFGDLDVLFEQLSQPVVIELGKPLPKNKFMPRRRVGDCPAAHNEALLGEKQD
jgi:hypothetical protein